MFNPLKIIHIVEYSKTPTKSSEESPKSNKIAICEICSHKLAPSTGIRFDPIGFRHDDIVFLMAWFNPPQLFGSCFLG